MRHDDRACLRQRPGPLQRTHATSARRQHAPPKPRPADAGRSPTTQRRRRDGAAAADQAARKMTEALVPPNPKLLDSATLIRRSCAVFATRSITLSRLGCVQVQRRRRDAVADRQDREHRLDRAGRAQQMPGGRLGGRHRQPRAPQSPNSRSTASSSRSSPSGVEVPCAFTYWMSLGLNPPLRIAASHRPEGTVMALGRAR